MEAEAATLCGAETALSDVAELKAYMPNAAADYLNDGATPMTAKQLQSQYKLLDGNDTALCQLNHVYVCPPTRSDSITTTLEYARNLGPSGKIALYTRAKAMLHVAGLTEDETTEYTNQFEIGFYIIYVLT